MITEKELERLLEAWGRAEREARRRAYPTLEAAPSKAGESESHELQHGLFLTIFRKEDGFLLHFEGSEDRWKGALLHLRWQWPDKEPLFGFVLLSSQGFRGRYSATLFSRDGRLEAAPYCVMIDPKAANPQLFQEAWQRATLKPRPQALQQWIEEHENEFPPRHREGWRSLA